ncbi:hypothetical protein [Paraburkholderia flagellata]|uniref:hypothetical protein n=1 Tax=Paraburkholderia flagellata TaxID=2883241 RepID=UPI001F37431C|nr:hypothetical protein [Paraburkholderia flagellata]
MSNPQENLFATTAACPAAFPVLAGHRVAGFSEPARLNLAICGVLLAGAQNAREGVLPSPTLGRRPSR